MANATTGEARFEKLTTEEPGTIRYRFGPGGRSPGGTAIANLDLLLIKEAWSRGMDVEDLADGFGPGMGTMGGDWSGVRDSSRQAKDAMLERALNFHFT